MRDSLAVRKFLANLALFPFALAQWPTIMVVYWIDKAVLLVYLKGLERTISTLTGRRVEKRGDAPPVGECLTLGDLADYFPGRLRPEEEERVELHLADCDSCAERAREAHRIWQNQIILTAKEHAASASRSKRINRSAWRNDLSPSLRRVLVDGRYRREPSGEPDP